MSANRVVDVLVGPDGQETTWQFVTPDMAKEWLLKNVRNRRRRRMLVEKIKIELASGLWQNTHQGLAFNQDGEMIDGQHRCTAIVESNIGGWMMVTTNAKQKTATKIDGGGMRNLADQLFIAGVDNVSNSKIAALKVAMFGPHNRGPNGAGSYLAEEQAEALLNEWASEIEVASRLDGQKTVGNRLTSGIVIRALLSGANRSRVEEFVTVLKTGLPVTSNDCDMAAITLRDGFLMRRVESCGRADRGRDSYMKTEAALVAFIERRKLQKLNALSAEAFPLPLNRIPECCKLLV